MTHLHLLRTKFCVVDFHVVNETAANILRFVARDVNRFSAQHMIDDIKNVGVEPMIEEILDS